MPHFAQEPEPNGQSDLVCEPATSSVPVELLVEFKGMEGSPTHTPTAVDELCLAFGNFLEELEEVISPISPIPTSPVQLKVSCVSAGSAQLKISCVSRVPTQTPSSKVSQFLSPAFTGSLQPPTPTLTPLHGVDLPQVFSSPALPSKENPSAPPPVADSVTPPQPVDLSALPWLLPRLHQIPSS
ncbi:hypothetical protein DPX16_21403 [Anabarilius grahami]|uniref:Uncharacterized protein n=1 Tax=Anabarilius grahami TaxID=495550 RepID=A0A3N0XUZ9_ANAGA|nr:hypothetical protein DPX16_21403 [Anabarilius grahami]